MTKMMTLFLGGIHSDPCNHPGEDGEMKGDV
jgi:hypothetical protein